MLRELRIENLLLIERAELRLGEGLNAITGETGAGKTVLAHSLDLLMGGRARPQIVRPGASEAWVEGVFDLPEGLLDAPELADLAERLPEGESEVVLGRRVGTSGRTSAFIAGRAATASDLQLLGSRLLSFYGQHEHRKLTLAAAQAEVLDGFAGVAHLELRDEYRDAHRDCTRFAASLAELRDRLGARERDLDLFRFELSEIDAAAPDAAEDDGLAAERSRLRNAEGLCLAAASALQATAGGDDGDGGASAALSAAAGALEGVAGHDPALDAIAERVESLSLEVSDVAAELRSYGDSVEADPARLAGIEERLEALDRLKRKHGGTIESVLAYAERCRSEIARLEGAEEETAELDAALREAEARRERLGAKLTAGRRKAAKALQKRVAAELAELAMPDATLEVLLEERSDGHGADGRETVELRLATNPGIDPAPLRDAASGGELSRVMLALSSLASGSEATLVFDEIDAGIGGNTARRVGEKLRDLAEARQVLCITHLPQVASLAGTHFRIEKQLRNGTASAAVERLDGDALVDEITRMLGAERSDKAASRHARELLQAA